MAMEGCGETVAICWTIAIRLLLSAIKLARRRSPSERRQAVPTRLLLPLGKVHGPVGSQAMLSKRQYPEQHPSENSTPVHLKDRGCWRGDANSITPRSASGHDLARRSFSNRSVCAQT